MLIYEKITPAHCSRSTAELSSDGCLTVSTVYIDGAADGDADTGEVYLNLGLAATRRLSRLLGIPADGLPGFLARRFRKPDATDAFRRFCTRYQIPFDYGSLGSRA